jgi:hypothetical protein
MPRQELSEESRQKSFFAEPALAALLNDPITHMLMVADKVAKDDLDCLVRQARAQLQRVGPRLAPSSRPAA